MTTTRKAGLPICQHIFLGLDLLRTRERMMDALGAIQDAYPKTAAASRRAERALRDLDELRTELDNVSANENPAGDAWSPAIYYGANREGWEREVLPIWRQHRESNPPCCARVPEPQR